MQIAQLSTHSADRALLEQQIYCEVAKLAAIGLENDQFLEVRLNVGVDRAQPSPFPRCTARIYLCVQHIKLLESTLTALQTDYGSIMQLIGDVNLDIFFGQCAPVISIDSCHNFEAVFASKTSSARRSTKT